MFVNELISVLKSLKLVSPRKSLGSLFHSLVVVGMNDLANDEVLIMCGVLSVCAW